MNTDKIYAESLAEEYAPKDTSKVVSLRKLDARAKLPATIFTYSLGIAAALVAGVGMCLSMKVIGNGSSAIMALGIFIGIVGLFGMGINYPLYQKFLKKGKQKYAFEIMQLAKEISEQEHQKGF
ncbi:MAG: dihydropteridine reductase [Ruminococcus sp.]|nr:dihydropteridine reductase [Ruminococcus sp.]